MASNGAVDEIEASEPASRADELAMKDGYKPRAQASGSLTTAMSSQVGHLLFYHC
jgi:hypothetical protein